MLSPPRMPAPWRCQPLWSAPDNAQAAVNFHPAPYATVAALQASATPHARHHDELPRAGHGADRHLDQGGAVAARKGAAQRHAQLLGRARAFRRGAEAVRQTHEIGIGEVARDGPVSVVLLLDAAHIAEGAVDENHGDERNAVANGGGELGPRVEEAAIARDRQHRNVAARILRPERGGKAPAEIVLIARREERARL